MGWSPYQYYTCMPEEFYYASKGFFDNMIYQTMIQRKVAQTIWASAGGKPHDFNNFWPTEKQQPKEKIVWGDLREQIKKAHGIK